MKKILITIIILLNINISFSETITVPSSNIQSFRFEGADIDTVMTQYCQWTDKIYLKTDEVQASITLNVNSLTTEESIKVVESILAMNGIALIPMGEKFIKVVQANANDLVGQGMNIFINTDQKILSSDEFITSVIPLKNVQIKEVQAAVQHVLHSYGKILTLERSNSIMITDTANNVKRAKELVEFIDQATAQIEQRIYQIQFANAEDIASKIDEIITAAKGEEEAKISGNPYARTPVGVIRANANNENTKANQASISNTESSSAVLIQGDVKVLADERTNIIIIFSQSNNFTFFEKIIEVLDVAVDPEKTFEVINLEYSDAEELAATLNSLLGSSNENSSKPNDKEINTNTSLNQESNNISENNSDINLSEETTILADTRSNSILIMGSKDDINAIKKVIEKLDVKLEQVMIEAVIFEVDLTEEIKSGIDWLYKPSGVSAKSANITSGILNYTDIIPDISTEMIIEASSKDENVRVLSTPIIMTTDNTEAKLIVGEQRPVVTSTSTFGSSLGTQRSSYEYKDIGIELTVIPRINPQRVVVMEISQAADQVGGTVNIDSNAVPVIKNREFVAQISVKDRETVALGGIITSRIDDTATKLPILGDIPFIGKRLFGNTQQEEIQTELIILLTPYVLTTDSEIKKETQKRYLGSSMNNNDWAKDGWSNSNIEPPISIKNNVHDYIKSMKEKSPNKQFN